MRWPEHNNSSSRFPAASIARQDTPSLIVGATHAALFQPVRRAYAFFSYVNTPTSNGSSGRGRVLWRWKVKRQIEFATKKTKGKWNAVVTINGKSQPAMTAYSYFGKQVPPKAFAFALLRKDRGELLIFKDGSKDWLEYGDYTYRKCY
jgi:hypothetical protein